MAEYPLAQNAAQSGKTTRGTQGKPESRHDQPGSSFKIGTIPQLLSLDVDETGLYRKANQTCDIMNA